MEGVGVEKEGGDTGVTWTKVRAASVYFAA